MVSNNAYIRKVNAAVRLGKHNRGIRVRYTKTKPHKGFASTKEYSKYDQISVWKKAPRKRRVRRISKHLKEVILSRKDLVRHELWHIASPRSSEKKIRRKELRPLPKRLPPRIGLRHGYTGRRS